MVNSNKIIQEYILKGQEIFIGLEDSKKTWKLCVRSGRMIIHETSIPAIYENLFNYLSNKFPQCQIQLIYEAGFRGFGLHDRLEEDGIACIVTPPHTVTQEKCSRQKNDRIDARRLSQNLEKGDYKSCFIPDKELREDRQIARRYRQIQKNITRVCNQIRRTLEYHGLDEQFHAGSWSERDYREAREKLTILALGASLQYVFESMFTELDRLRQYKGELLLQLKRLANKERYKKNVKLLESAPGIGFLTAIRLLLELGEVTRFKSKEKFASFLGVIPSDYSTGERDRKGPITKQGNRDIRAMLIESAWVAIRYDPVLLNKYQRVTKNMTKKDDKKKAIVAVSHTLASKLRAILISGGPYIKGFVR